MSTTRKTSDPLRRFRLMTVRLTMVVMMVLVAITYQFDPLAAKGMLLGGIAGTLGFWIMAIRLEKVAREKPEKVHYAALTWSFYRYGLYGAVLYKGFTLDRVSYHGLIGALIGIFIIRVVMMYLAVSGRDQSIENNEEAEDAVQEIAGETANDSEPLDDTDG